MLRAPLRLPPAAPERHACEARASADASRAFGDDEEPLATPRCGRRPARAAGADDARTSPLRPPRLRLPEPLAHGIGE
jgi:hypothetical protein